MVGDLHQAAVAQTWLQIRCPLEVALALHLAMAEVWTSLSAGCRRPLVTALALHQAVAVQILPPNAEVLQHLADFWITCLAPVTKPDGYRCCHQKGQQQWMRLRTAD